MMANHWHSMPLLCISVLVLSLLASHSWCFPFSASNRWIVDLATNERVKLLCVNWPAHIGVMLAEGLDKQPLKHIVSQLPKLGLNCVRLTWATYMFTRHANQTVQQALHSLGLSHTISGIQQHNPTFLPMTHPQAYVAVVDALNATNIKVISDNHISQPKWCCAPDDGNGFFGDKDFNPQEWLQGLSMAARLLKGKPNVVGMSLRNELRGASQNLEGWYRNVTQGALMVHQQNPSVLVIISGFYNDNDLSFLKTNPLNLTLEGKLVYEVHSYPVSGEKKDWGNQSANLLCGKVKQELDGKAGFLTTGSNPAPLLMTEFGIDLVDRTEGEQRWLTCVLAWLATMDLGWAWWGLQGSYYYREDKPNQGESYGLLDFDWKAFNYPEFPHRFQLLLNKLQEPSSKMEASSILYHPQSGECLKESKVQKQVEAGACSKASGWSQEGSQIKLKGQNVEYCLKASGAGQPVILTADCSNTNQTSWKAITESGMHWATMDAQGSTLCLQKDANSSTILTDKCICADSNPACLDNPQSQWFQFVTTNVYA